MLKIYICKRHRNEANINCVTVKPLKNRSARFFTLVTSETLIILVVKGQIHTTNFVMINLISIFGKREIIRY